MTAPLQTAFVAAEPEKIARIPGRLVVFADEAGTLDPLARRVDRLTRGALGRLRAGADFARAKAGSGHVLAWPGGLAAEAVQVVKLPKRPTPAEARLAGAAIAGFNAGAPLTVLAGGQARVAEVAQGLALRAYAFETYRTPGKDTPAPNRSVAFQVRDPEAAAAAFAPLAAQLDGVCFTRDLVSEPANVLGTVEFARRLLALKELGIEVEVLDEPELESLGMRTLLAVGQGSESPSKVVVMQWRGGGDAAPVALVGKGVVFDTGGISIKPGAGMEEMTMDMGGAAVVAGVMRTLALRKAPANVVGLVGLVENMPDGKAQRPGDVVRSMKGDTVEVINTDAEGRLVLADVLWYAQERFKPRAMVDLATLTGAIIIALGHEMAGVFANDDKLADAFLAAAKAEGEGAWRMPLAPAFDELLKSRIADMANVGGRPAGSVTAAQFLQRFVKEGTPWMHLDIAGVAYLSKDSDLAPKGATGWGVRALDRLIRDGYQG
ncbi:leucyl aminopeptidase [Amaricoccus sp.]|uniref:leucyl aminopeptidase n=1 Tax=Amaricoccus sp. TaxID=1872485 RepID=UPI00262802DA|nr:leucyl aminopeptidase [Amaricoccus sp.]HRO11446.1 leucyl aminopeptidase [Amaricoccus sp.]